MSKQNSGNEGKKTNQEGNKPLSGKVRVELDRTPFDKIANAINQKETAQQQTGNNTNIAANRQADAQVTANYISAFIFIATLFLFIWNIKGINAAEKSADAADSSVKTQLKIAGENQREFRIINEPFLEADSIKFDMNYDTRIPITTFRITNLGKLSCQVLDGRFALMYYMGNHIDTNDFAKSKMDGTLREINNVYLGSKIQTWHPAKPANDTIMAYVALNKVRVGFMGEIRYISFATGNKRTYKFLAAIFDPKEGN